jgi:DNA-binding NarL/FixJ family response regulator
LQHARSHGDPWIAARALGGLANIALAGGRAERAARLLGAKAALDEVTDGHIHPRERADQARMVAAARAALGEEKFAAVWAAGRLLSLEQATAEALAGVADPTASSPAAAVPAALSGLSRREREVLHLLAKRYSDKEIAELLFISPRTVMTHATNIFTKLGVANRREAAAVATRYGLV